MVDSVTTGCLSALCSSHFRFVRKASIASTKDNMLSYKDAIRISAMTRSCTFFCFMEPFLLYSNSFNIAMMAKSGLSSAWIL